MMNIKKTPIGQVLSQQQAKIHTQHLRDLFAQQPDRYQQYSLTAANLTLDFSKNIINDDVLINLIKLAEHFQLPEKIQQLLRGEKVNFTEQRAAKHMVLRNLVDMEPEITAQLHKMEKLAQTITMAKIKYIVNLGIGGSDLGPALVVDALRPYHINELKFYFVSNVDPSAINDVLAIVNPHETLFIVASKTFTTQETLINAGVAKKWLTQHNCNLKQHMIAITAKPEIAEQFGIASEKILQFWNWVGGRYSVWSSIGFAIVLAIGMKHFKEFLTGACDMDQHFTTTPLRQNMPVIMGLLTVWYVNFWQVQTQAIIPYDQHLQLFPAYLQQLIMESNGKSARADGVLSNEATSPVIWGQVGTNGQHAFHQLLHQGTHLIPVDFILPIRGHCPDVEQQKLLVANCIAQSEALMVGKNSEDKHKHYPGNRPSNTILLSQLTPQHLGALLALYEHKTFVESIIWHINAFDQWGVELGKKLAQNILLAMDDNTKLKQHDASTQAQIKFAISSSN